MKCKGSAGTGFGERGDKGCQDVTSSWAVGNAGSGSEGTAEGRRKM